MAHCTVYVAVPLAGCCAEAPALLNQYACAVEDALVEQVQRGQSQTQLLKAAGEERTAMNIMLTKN